MWIVLSILDHKKKKIKNTENRFFLMISILNYFYNFIKILNSET